MGQLILIGAALICFIMGFVGRPASPPLQWGWLGMFFAGLAFSHRAMIYYSQARGEFLLPDDSLLKGCYAGGGTDPTLSARYRNNPLMQDMHGLGPLPQGVYTISPAHTIPHLGPCVMALTPDPANEMFGRSGFFVHGDNPAGDHTASDGCIVAGPAIRQQVADLVAAGGQQLTVTA